MSFGFSPSDVVKLVEVSTRVYLAFKDANENSEVQVEGLVREFTAFHHCLVELDELMREYGKPLPFPFDDFKDTIDRCEKSIKPYADNLIDKKMNFTKMVYTIKYMGKEKEIDGLRKQISGHYQALQMCISFLQLRLHLEATKQTQRLLDTAPFRSMSLGGQWYTSNAFANASRTDTRALPAMDDADGLFQEWLVFSRWLKSENDRIAQEAGLTRPLSLGDTPAAAPSGDAQTAAVLYHLRRELEDAIVIEENRAKRAAVERRTHLAPSDAVRQEVRNLPPVPQRTYTLDTEFSGMFSGFDANPNMSESTATLRPGDTTPSPTASPGAALHDQSYFGQLPTGRVPSISTSESNFATSPTSMRSGPITADTTPELDSSHPLHSRFSVTSLITLALGDSALEWKRLCHKVQVERRTSSGPPESRECDIHWRHNEDTGLAIRSVYRSGGTVKVWTMQSFPATGPSIPLTTSYPDGDVSIDFPRASHGRLDKRCTDIKYTFGGQEATVKLQSLLYTNNGKDAAELLFDRCVLTVSSNLNKPECRRKNVRLWKRSEEHNGRMVDILVLLFYTSALPDERAHWVEEPHYAFQWLTDDVYKKSSDKVTLVFSKEPGRWNRDKLFQRRKSSSASTMSATDANSIRRDSGQSTRSPPPSPGIPSLVRSGTHTSVASTTSNRSSRSLFGRSGHSRIGDLNRFQYSELEIKFQSKSDRNDFIAVWQQHVKQLISPLSKD
ncbi:hypothetical protein BU25DRAFT_161267 [Macroventuria anomochaeta]|uniref:Uncharacterized protein n=1 Tax=Macroventuria anomochaeta TaxID=301207 RepID=A0ACB6RQX0_9PLEO|nr:uncharacterized protein BU25DRAFT_161267 [Macroventuria anomochaeta]KAF2624441.1 hypothetical protein BU25DRAFT_161267 [Macroventuria anomochaeta]